MFSLYYVNSQNKTMRCVLSVTPNTWLSGNELWQGKHHGNVMVKGTVDKVTLEKQINAKTNKQTKQNPFKFSIYHLALHCCASQFGTCSCHPVLKYVSEPEHVSIQKARNFTGPWSLTPKQPRTEQRGGEENGTKLYTVNAFWTFQRIIFQKGNLSKSPRHCGLRILTCAICRQRNCNFLTYQLLQNRLKILVCLKSQEIHHFHLYNHIINLGIQFLNS